jgi:hypothetical protein
VEKIIEQVLNNFNKDFKSSYILEKGSIDEWFIDVTHLVDKIIESKAGKINIFGYLR